MKSMTEIEMVVDVMFEHSATEDGVKIAEYIQYYPALIARVKKLEKACAKVLVAAHEAHLAMPEAKVISMSNSDFRELRDLGLSIDDLSKALMEDEE